jgi:hypothetical protein
MSFQIYRSSLGSYSNFGLVLMCMSFKAIFPLLYCLFAKRFQRMRLHFSFFCTIFIVITTLETRILAYDPTECYEDFMINLVLLMHLAVISYNQKHILILYLIFSIYIIVRSRWEEAGNFRWIRFWAAYVLGLTIMY